MKNTFRDLKAASPRLLAEFFVIVVGVLAALGVDSWVSWSNDRVLEQEYLERLLEDVRYDLAEIEFVRNNAQGSIDYATLLLDAAKVASLETDELAAAIIMAGRTREVDPSRSTFNELVNSGRIGLLRSRAVRSEIASYQRTFDEMGGYWRIRQDRFRQWMFVNLPQHVREQFRRACSNSEFVPPVAPCRFTVLDWSPDDIRQLLLGADARERLMYQQNVTAAALDIIFHMQQAAEKLEAVLVDELES